MNLPNCTTSKQKNKHSPVSTPTSTLTCWKMSPHKTSPISRINCTALTSRKIALSWNGSMTTVLVILQALFRVPLFWLKARPSMLSTGRAVSIMPNNQKPLDSVTSMIVYWPSLSCLKHIKEFCTSISIFITVMVLRKLSIWPTESWLAPSTNSRITSRVLGISKTSVKKKELTEL